MNWLDFVLSAALAASFLLLSWLFWKAAELYWVASGSPDVNGDPENDAGFDAPWDHGSAATADRAIRDRVLDHRRRQLIAAAQSIHEAKLPPAYRPQPQNRNSHGRTQQG